jgi:hypothetical protein
MSQPENELARRIVEHLDAGVDQLDPATREGLLAAREQALAHYRGQREPVLGLAWAGHAIARVSGHRFYSVRNLVAVTTLVLGLTGLVIWNSLGPTNELADIDAGLLTDELPINAYLDKGFDSWLKRAPR